MRKSLGSFKKKSKGDYEIQIEQLQLKIQEQTNLLTEKTAKVYISFLIRNSLRISISFWIFIEDFAYYFTTNRTFLVPR